MPHVLPLCALQMARTTSATQCAELQRRVSEVVEAHTGALSQVAAANGQVAEVRANMVELVASVREVAKAVKALVAAPSPSQGSWGECCCCTTQQPLPLPYHV